MCGLLRSFAVSCGFVYAGHVADTDEGNVFHVKQGFKAYMTEKRFTIEARWERWLTAFFIAVFVMLVRELPFLVSLGVLALVFSASRILVSIAARRITKESKAGNQW